MATDFGTNSSETNYTYTNQEFDPESGLFYYNARYYNPRLGRFISRDTVLGGDGDALSRNLYIYVKNNPLKYVDPTGKSLVIITRDYNSIKMNTGTYNELGEPIQTTFYPNGKPKELSDGDKWGVAVMGSIASGGSGVLAKVPAWIKDLGTAAAVGGKASKELENNASGRAGSGGSHKEGSAGGPGAGKRYIPETVKQAELERTNGRCVFCDIDTTTEPGPNQLNFDHSIPVKKSGNNTIENVQTTCRTCNLSKGTRTSKEFIEYVKERVIDSQIPRNSSEFIENNLKYFNK